MALARLYHRCGKDRAAATAYKDVLKYSLFVPYMEIAVCVRAEQLLINRLFFRECPTSGEAIRSLLFLGVKGAEVSSLVLSSSATSLDYQDWYATLVIELYNSSTEEFFPFITPDCLFDHFLLMNLFFL